METLKTLEGISTLKNLEGIYKEEQKQLFVKEKEQLIANNMRENASNLLSRFIL